MTLDKDILHILTNKAIEAAHKAGEYIASYNRKSINIDTKQTNGTKNSPCGGTSLASQVVTEVDIKSEEIILEILHPTLDQYNLGLLSEERMDDDSRLNKEYFWCIDPLDGTLPFSQGLDGFSVAIALVAKNGTPLIGVVCDPTTGDIYSAYKDAGAYKNGEKWDCTKDISNSFTLIIDRSFTKHPKFKEVTTFVNDRIQQEGYSVFKMKKQGGAVMNAIWTLENRPSCYFKLPKKELGGGSLWDFAATACIFNEINAKATNFKGGKLDLNRKDSTFMNHEGVLFTCSEKVFSIIQEIKAE